MKKVPVTIHSFLVEMSRTLLLQPDWRLFSVPLACSWKQIKKYISQSHLEMVQALSKVEYQLQKWHEQAGRSLSGAAEGVELMGRQPFPQLW